MKFLQLTLLLFFNFTLVQAQTKISGTLKSTKGTPVANANILLKNTYDGTSTDSTGRFTFSTAETGVQTLLFSALNFETDSVIADLNNSSHTFNLIIKPSINLLETVSISAGYFIAGDGKKGAVLTALDIATTAGSNADVFAALQTLPGAQTSFSESGLFVRGGAASETKTYFDGMLLKSPFNPTVPDQASRGRLSAFLFKGTSFSAGGYSAQYGQALSSALILESTDLPEKTTTGISVLSVGAGLDQNIRFKNSALTIGGSYYNLRPTFDLIRQQNHYIKAPEQISGSIQYKHKIAENGMFKFYATYGTTEIAFDQDNIDEPLLPNFFSNSNKNIYVNSTYKEYLNTQWKLDAGFSYNRDTNTGLMSADSYNRTDELTNGKITLTNYFGTLSNLKFGAETFNTGRTEGLNRLEHGYTDQISAGFAESDLFLTNKLVLRAGLRAEYSSYLEKYNLAPRTSLGLKTGINSQVSFAYGRFYQNPEDEYLIVKRLNFEVADHYILKYEINTADRNFRIEGYFKDYNHLTKENLHSLDNSGKGYAKGFELFWRDKKTFKNGDYYISYSYLDTKRDFRDFPTLATPSFAAKHTASAVYKQFIENIQTQVGITYTFASGRPYVNPNNSIYMGDRTGSYNNLSLTVSHLTHIFKHFTVLYLNANNVTGFNNVFGYAYSRDGLSRRAILPSSKRNLIVGILMTIGDSTFVR
jgi:hypothetical protein